jgi:hypothetical protein
MDATFRLTKEVTENRATIAMSFENQDLPKVAVTLFSNKSDQFLVLIYMHRRYRSGMLTALLTIHGGRVDLRNFSAKNIGQFDKNRYLFNKVLGLTSPKILNACGSDDPMIRQTFMSIPAYTYFCLFVCLTCYLNIHLAPQRISS